MDTWNQKRYTWFHWPRHAPRASLQCVYLSTNGYTKFIDKHTSCCTRQWNLNQKTSPPIRWCLYGNGTTNTARIWAADLSHSGEVCNPAFLPLSLSVAQWQQKKCSIVITDKTQEYEDVMYGRTFVNFSHWQHVKNVPCPDKTKKTEIFLFLL